ncbi:hypothetical protein I302_107418 [Kwoniella bestiolae CBS 10118]|uniref:Uncharacterized protein n=1 Tax=Kwoniella bestiolae CBS 10118 TaxID=1296100 RepID=A0A1B9FYK4_9TREE|nr:hypothetical protein I302_06841 [Kwoniella bestiolae CBS 10118]OCF23856.1 hypothetical protein I302_06841 [Kwoniella bestiolae CBS 10118]
MAQLTAEGRIPEVPVKWNIAFCFPENVEQLELPLVMPRHMDTFDSVPYARQVEPFRVYALDGAHHVKQTKVVHFDKRHLPGQLGNGSLKEVIGVEFCEKNSKANGSCYASKCDQTGYNLIMQKLMMIGGDYCGEDTCNFADVIKGKGLAKLAYAAIDTWKPFIGLVNISKIGWKRKLGWYQQINNLPNDYRTIPFTDLTTGQLGIFPPLAPLPAPGVGGGPPSGPPPGGSGPSGGGNGGGDVW